MGRGAIRAGRLQTIAALAAWFDEVYPSAHEDVQNVLFVSFIEHLPWPPDPNAEGIAVLLGPNLRQELREYQGSDPESVANIESGAADSGGQPPELYGPEYVRLAQLIRDDPEQAWSGIVPFVLTADRPLEEIALLEDFVDLHSERFLERLIAIADADARFGVALGGIHLGDMDGPAIDRIGEWQDQYRMHLLPD